jgi:hypothetical protein
VSGQVQELQHCRPVQALHVLILSDKLLSQLLPYSALVIIKQPQTAAPLLFHNQYHAVPVAAVTAVPLLCLRYYQAAVAAAPLLFHSQYHAVTVAAVPLLFHNQYHAVPVAAVAAAP